MSTGPPGAVVPGGTSKPPDRQTTLSQDGSHEYFFPRPIGSPCPVSLFSTGTIQAGQSKRKTKYTRLDELDEISLRMRISNLEARLALVDIAISDLVREINSASTSYERTIEVRSSLDAKRSEQANLLTQLDQMRRSHPSIQH